MISIKKHLEANMLDDEDKADHEASDAAHPSQEPEEGVDVHAAWEGPVNHKSKLSDRGITVKVRLGTHPRNPVMEILTPTIEMAGK